MSKHFYFINDNETTKKQTVADFGGVVIDKQGKIHEQFGAMVHGHFGKLPLFSDPKANPDDFWSEQSAQRRTKKYDDMLESGQRSISSPALINIWLAKINAQYNPVLTAYNLSFDFGKCANTGIDLGIFAEKFCLMKAAKKTIGITAEYHAFCDIRGLMTPTGRPRMTADAMAKFIDDTNYEGSLADEPHTALEDARDYEAMILTYILRTHTRKQILELGR